MGENTDALRARRLAAEPITYTFSRSRSFASIFNPFRRSVMPMAKPDFLLGYERNFSGDRDSPLPDCPLFDLTE